MDGTQTIQEVSTNPLLSSFVEVQEQDNRGILFMDLDLKTLVSLVCKIKTSV